MTELELITNEEQSYKRRKNEVIQALKAAANSSPTTAPQNYPPEQTPFVYYQF